MGWPILVALLGACGGEEARDVSPVVSPPPAVVEPVSGPAPPPVPTGGPVAVRVEFVGVGRLYQGYFQDTAALTALGEALSACFASEAFLRISYDDAERLGRIVVRVEPGAGPCRPVATEAGWDLAPVVPITTALAAYRDALARSYDLRLAGFQIGVAYRGGSEVCTLWASGSHPPDGTAFSPCVELRGEARCLPGGDVGVRVLVPERRRRVLAACLGGSG